MTAAATEAARSFVEAVAWGEHQRVWDLLAPEGRRTVIRIAERRGMDPALAARLRDGTAHRSEHDRFLTDLLNGLRADLADTDLDSLRFDPDPDPEPGRVRVVLVSPLPPALDDGGGLPVGWVELSERDGRWQVEHLVPRPGPTPGP